MKGILTLLILGTVGFQSCCTKSNEAAVDTPNQAITFLKEGNERFLSGKSIHPNTDAERRNETATAGQKPFAAIIACSDSRVPVETLFDRGIGDLFVIRTAGNAVNSIPVMGSIEYAVTHLGVKAVVVLGHEGCGAVTAAITEGEDTHDHGDAAYQGQSNNDKTFLSALIEDIREGIPEHLRCVDSMDQAIQCNTLLQKEFILANTQLHPYLANQRVGIYTANYDIHTGAVTFDMASFK